ncbi:hypothetical protein [Flammeovirga pacifica]|uniref:Uncharacterized protein n=1 Tax=Flammeovirga pacifica TaxID=915059 RepID=A0A1S1Z0Y1_FLAPC|nr:hypothetical protein [Flammeovirga pacifica]OHX66843.1 hypothetical protein NH26_10985 [Flammeovirga pacifica]
MKKIIISLLLAGSVMAQVYAQGTNIHETKGDYYRTQIKEFSFTQKQVFTEINNLIQIGARSKGFDDPIFIDQLGVDNVISNARQWDAVFPDEDFWKSGLQSRGFYVSPKKRFGDCLFLCQCF